MKHKDIRLQRRQFLGTVKSAGLLGAALALLGKGNAAKAQEAAKPASDDRRSGQYRETEHVRKYYASARRL